MEGRQGFDQELTSESGSIKYVKHVYIRDSAVTQTYHAQIYVTLRPSVLDPAGTAVQSGLKHMGYDNVQQVRIGKYIEVSLEANSEASAHEQLDRICDQLLANPVIENYRIELMQAAAA